VESLANLPAGTVVDGEVVAIDESGRPNFNLLQNFRSAASRIQYHIFDVLCYQGRDLTRLPLVERRALLKSIVSIQESKNQDRGLRRGNANRFTVSRSQARS